MVSGIVSVACEWCVERDDVALKDVAVQVLRRIVDHDMKAVIACHAYDPFADVPCSDNAEGEVCRIMPGAQVEYIQNSLFNIVANGLSVASRATDNVYALLSAIIEVDMVGADGSCGDEAYTAAVKQSGIATRARTNDERIGIAYGGRSELLGFEEADISKAVKNALQKRYVFVD